MVRKSKNATLNRAKREKRDEFYTPIEAVNEELGHYFKFFNGKTVYCNCGDPFESAFFKSIVLRFDLFGLKKFVSIVTRSSELAGTELPLTEIAGLKGVVSSPKDKPAFKIEITWDDLKSVASPDGVYNQESIKKLFRKNPNVVTPLDGDGDFRSQECIDILKTVDVVVTNPPFSLFREYFKQLIEHEKDFLILGSLNAVTYKDVFPYLKDVRVRLGFNASSIEFKTAYGKSQTLNNTVWFTTFNIRRVKNPLLPVSKYDPEKYPKYDNYDAIEVSRVRNIPVDYDGIIGVPISYLLVHDPEQFEILGISHAWCKEAHQFGAEKANEPILKGKRIYSRVFIRRKK